ncbi:MAG: hypothetical protein ABIJ16_07375 [Bacteroidota bacterium]
MKIAIIFTMIFTVSLFLSQAKQAKAQNCERQMYCDENFEGEYVFNLQSRYGTLPLGEKKRIKTSCYGNKRYRIFVCGEPEIGEVNYKVIKEVRKNVKKISQIRKDTVVVYKTDEYGEIMYPEENNYEPIEISRSVKIDTVYETTRVTEEKVLFDSKKNSTGKNYWEASIEGQGYSIIIEAEMPPGDPDIEECVNFYIGSRSLSNKRFGATGKQSIID